MESIRFGKSGVLVNPLHGFLLSQGKMTIRGWFQLFFGIFTPIPGEYEPIFDLRIFFRWVGSTQPPTQESPFPKCKALTDPTEANMYTIREVDANDKVRGFFF